MENNLVKNTKVKRPKVLCTVKNFGQLCPKAKELLISQGITLIENSHDDVMPPEKLKDVMKDVDFVIAGGDTWDAQVFEYSPALKFLVRFGVGTDKISLESATQRNILIGNTAGANADAVADYTLGLILAITRQIPLTDRTTREGCWYRPVGVGLYGKTLGIVGLGNIGRKVARRAQAFGLNVIAYDLNSNVAMMNKLNIRHVELGKLFRTADIVSLHIPATEKTFNLIDKSTLQQMKPTSYLINTARGELIDEDALYHALKNKVVAGAALDVFNQEPYSSVSPLSSLENIVLSPHNGAETQEAIDNGAMMIAQAILDYIAGVKPANLLNPEVWQFHERRS